MQLRRCTSILILFFCSLVASCGKSSGSDAPKEGPAGQVQEVQGLVQATRSGQATRNLSTGDTIYVDDNLESGEGASAVIVFGHNNATWQLSAGYKGKVVDSLPWRTKRHKTSALVRADQTQTAAAGRNSEREAAESIETMVPSPAMPAMQENVAAAEEAPMAVAPAAKVPDTLSRGRRRRPASPPPPPKPKRAAEPEKESRTGKTLGIGQSTGSPGMATGGSNNRGGGKGGVSLKADKGRLVTEAAPMVAAPTPPVAPSPGPADSPEAEEDSSSPKLKERKKTKPKLSREETDSSLLSQNRFLKLMRSAGKSCQSKHGGKGKVHVHLVVENSKLKTLAIKGTSELGKVATCMKSKLRSQRNKGSFTVKTSITFAAQ